MLGRLGFTGQTGPPKGLPMRFCRTVHPTLPARSVAPMTATDFGVKMEASGLRGILTRSWAGSMMSAFGGATVAEAMREFSFESCLVSIAGFCGDFTAKEPIGSAEVTQGEDEAEGPPDEADVERMRSGESAGDGNVARGVSG